MALRSWTEQIAEFRPVAYQYGVNPLEFPEMTLKQIGEYVTARQEQEKQDFMKSARLLDNAAMKIIVGRNLAHPKIISLHEFYPTLFDSKDQSAPPTNMTQERKNKIITDKWKAFLGLK